MIRRFYLCFLHSVVFWVHLSRYMGIGDMGCIAIGV